MSELEKYEGLYKSEAKYGHSFHGKGAIPHVAKLGPKSIIDIGCGGNEFLQNAKHLPTVEETVGCDFASPHADITCSATAIPIPDKQFDLVTSFDVLEHLLPDEVDTAMGELARIADRFIFSICYKPSKREWDGKNLHPTVRTEEWWVMRIMRAGGVEIKIKGRYIMGRWAKPLKINKDASVILIGNGPSILDLDGNQGKIIDSFNEVVRFNRYIIEGSEEKLGSKTTLWSTYGHGRTPLLRGEVPMPESDRPKRVLYTHGELGTGPSYKSDELFHIPNWFWVHTSREIKSRFSWRNGFNVDPSFIIPSSGLLVASFLLNVVGVSQLTLVGFDHFSKEKSKIHHYWRPIPTKRVKEHDGETEARMFFDLMTNDRVRYL